MLDYITLMYIAALRLNIPAMSVDARWPSADRKKLENRKQRALQAARRGFEWADAWKDAEANDRAVVTPQLVATKSARRCWQRTQKHARDVAATENQNEQLRSQRGPASAEPAGTSNWRRSTSARNSRWDIGLQSGGEMQEDGEWQEDSIADWHGFDGNEYIPKGFDPNSIY